MPFSHWSHVGLGTGRLASVGRGTTPEQVNQLLSSMQDLGVTVIDTADSYSSGQCERRLGQAMRGRRESFVVVTKAGYRYGDLPWPFQPLNPFIKKAHQKLSGGQCHAPPYLTDSLNRSLQRLQIEQVDCFLLHDPPLAALLDPAVLTSLRALQQAGKTRHLGVSSGEPQVLTAALDAGCFTVIQSPANPRTVAELAPLWHRATAKGIHLMANHVFFSGNVTPAALPLNLSLHQCLMRYISSYFRHGTILVGTRNAAHLQEAAQWAASPLTAQECLEVEEKLTGASVLRSRLRRSVLQ